MDNLRDSIVQAFNPSHLNLILLPTEQCNFRCVYCYEDFLIGRMSHNVVSAVKKLIQVRFEDLESLEISWFGGEPLLAKDIVLDISKHILTHLPANFSYSANMTTNGYFLDTTSLKELVSVGVNTYQITLDGVSEIHDNTRKLANGSGTFKKILNNLLRAKSTNIDFTIILRIHFSPEKYSHIKNVIDFLLENFNGDQRFQFYFKAIEKLGGPNDHNFIRWTEENEKKVKEFLESFIPNKNQIYQLPFEDSYICYASKPNSFLIRPNGIVGKCTVGFNENENKLGQLEDDGTMTIDSKKLLSWMRGFSSLNQDELSCPYNFIKQNTQEPEIYANLVQLPVY